MKERTHDTTDLEHDSTTAAYLQNNVIRNYSWQDVHAEIGHRSQKSSFTLENVHGVAKAGTLTALMGPSGSGKTTLLNCLAHRKNPKASQGGRFLFNEGSDASAATLRNVSSFVEQEDALIGSLTVRETLAFAARLSLSSSTSWKERKQRVDQVLSAFGLRNQADTIVGTPIKKGISGGQKRRLSIASQLITAPKILFLDEPTSGLDSKASFEVVKFLKSVALKNKLIVIASIHQPSAATFALFDDLLLLANGRTCYNASISAVGPYFDAQGLPLPTHVNPPEHLLEITSTDFVLGEDVNASSRVQRLQLNWEQSAQARTLLASLPSTQATDKDVDLILESDRRTPFLTITLALLHRSFIKSYRDVVAYGIRFAMYLGLAVMMGTVWLRLPPTQSSIQPFINAIFFGSAFMSFMAVAYVPAFLEDRATFIKERANGLYGATPFMIANFLIGLPYLFLISLLFSIISYYLSNFRPGGSAFFTWVMWLYLDLLAGESLVVLISSLFPNFVVALALTAFANGLWMSVGGFLVSPKVLNVFWRYVFHYIDYQAYVFRGMMANEFGGDRIYDCGEGCQCMYQTDLASECAIDGKGVLEQYGYQNGNTGKWVGIMLGILAGYRFLGWLVTYLRKS